MFTEVVIKGSHRVNWLLPRFCGCWGMSQGFLIIYWKISKCVDELQHDLAFSGIGSTLAGFAVGGELQGPSLSPRLYLICRNLKKDAMASVLVV